MEIELKPCPFCGSKPIFIEGHNDWVSCPNCHATGPGAHIVGGLGKVAEAWNTRKSPNCPSLHTDEGK